ncbi:MAG: hypothetical protein EZS28_008801 [Streblomastix strix]|uniref:Uncharacterized protein n=1 Tax=Streblomastix strix TaxID=222440 RepID=A0A5J4WLD0_9EUKA|nr:MAG: hypothetical protein EZS28_008801 [Streblomastix strix]
MINNAREIDLSEYYNKTEVDRLISDAAIGEIDISNYYSKIETDTLLDAKADKTELIDSYSKTEDDAHLLLKADQLTTYTKTETDTLFDVKADKTDTYTKTETDTLLDAKADKTELIASYSKTEDDALLLLKADQLTTYTKTETDTLLDAKADKTELIDAYSKCETYTRDKVYTKTETDKKLDDEVSKTEQDEYVDITSAQTITGQKQFGIISVSSISKQSKNDASILLASGGDMLVSSLVSQPQLQEVRDIASGKSKGYVFATTQEMNTWMEDQENVAKLAIGDNLYIVDKEVMDYWWDGTNLRALETELPDMSNVVTTLGAATGNGNAITDISIDDNTITPAKNETFVTTSYDQNIGGQKTFTTTIHSVGIAVQNYDNNSAVCAGGGVKAISDIVSTVDLTDYYNKTKTDELLGDKANVGDLDNYYDKHDVDEMINDANQLINDANELIRAVEDQIPPPVTISNFVQKTGEELDQTILGRLRQQLDERVPFDSISDNLYITKFDALKGLVTSETFNDQLLDKADKTDLANYVTLETAQSINANKTFNNAYRFTSTIDGMSIITEQSFVKSGADNTVVLLGAGGTKSISEFATTIDDSNYVKKDSDVQDIQGILRKSTLDQPYPEQTDDEYVTLGAVNGEFVSSIYSGSMNGNLTANQFIKSGGTDQQVLLANGSTKAISEFGSGSIDLSNYVDKSSNQTINGTKTFSQQIIAPSLQLSGQNQQFLLANGGVTAISNYLSKQLDQTVEGSNTFTRNITAFGFIKQNGTNQQVLLANGSTKSLSEFGSGSVDDSNYVKKTGDNLYIIQGNLRRGLFDPEFEEPSEDDDDYVTRREVTTQFVTIFGTQQIAGLKTFTGNVTAPAFIKSGGTNQDVLLANGSTKPLSEFSGGGGDMSNYVKKTGADIQVVNGILRKGDDEEEESEDDDDYITRGEYNNKTNNIITSKFYNFYQVLTPPVMFAGYTATQSSLIKINNQMYFFYLVVKPDDIIQAYQGRNICTVNPPPLYTIFRTLNSDYLAMFTNDGYVHFTTQATVWTQNSNVVINTFWVR